MDTVITVLFVLAAALAGFHAGKQWATSLTEDELMSRLTALRMRRRTDEIVTHHAYEMRDELRRELERKMEELR